MIASSWFAFMFKLACETSSLGSNPGLFSMIGYLLRNMTEITFKSRQIIIQLDSAQLLFQCFWYN